MNDSSSLTTDGQNATTSICPKGWKLPTGGDSGQLVALYTAYDEDSSAFFSAASLAFSGYYDGGVGGQGDSGAWWSRSVYGGLNAYDLYAVSSGPVYPASNGGRRSGSSVRCVASGS